jgi:hypothetical protein
MASISIWFFIGTSLLVDGLLILATGIYELIHPPAAPVVLFKLHANIWWGGILFAIGVLYSYRFAPRPSAATKGNASPACDREEVHVKQS